MSEPVDLALGILDHQLVDCEGRRCGKADDLELELGGGAPRVTAVVVGAGAWRRRGVVGRTISRLGGGRVVKVPWEEVASVDSAINLKRSASELRLGRGDDRARTWVERLPGARL